MRSAMPKRLAPRSGLPASLLACSGKDLPDAGEVPDAGAALGVGGAADAGPPED